MEFKREQEITKALDIGEGKPYLFKIKLWQYDPFEYVLAYGRDETEARQKACKPFRYNSGQPVHPGDLTLVTYF